jgi:hypothetical protein
LPFLKEALDLFVGERLLSVSEAESTLVLEVSLLFLSEFREFATSHVGRFGGGVCVLIPKIVYNGRAPLLAIEAFTYFSTAATDALVEVDLGDITFVETAVEDIRHPCPIMHNTALMSGVEVNDTGIYL